MKAVRCFQAAPPSRLSSSVNSRLDFVIEPFPPLLERIRGVGKLERKISLAVKRRSGAGGDSRHEIFRTLSAGAARK